MNAWLKIVTHDSVKIIVSQAEMGQGIRTALHAVLAEELGVDWSRHFAGIMIRPRNLNTVRFVGYQPGLTLERTFSTHFSSAARYFYLFTGRFLHDTPSSKGVDYLYATITVGCKRPGSTTKI